MCAFILIAIMVSKKSHKKTPKKADRHSVMQVSGGGGLAVYGGYVWVGTQGRARAGGTQSQFVWKMWLCAIEDCNMYIFYLIAIKVFIL